MHLRVAKTTAEHLGTVSKVAMLAGGIGAGLGVSAAANHYLVGPERAAELEADGITMLSSREATATVGPAALVAAAGVGSGILRRTGTSGITSATLGAALMLASTAVGTTARADKPEAGDFMRTLAVTSGIAAAAFAVGAVNFVSLNTSKRVGLAVMGFAAGSMAPEAGEYFRRIPGDLRRGYEYRER